MRGPVEGWGFVLRSNAGLIAGVVKGCEHPLPCLHVIPKRVNERKIRDPFNTRIPSIWRWSKCLVSHAHIVCPGDEAVLLDPVARLEELVSGGWVDPLVEELYTVAKGSLGVTGSLLYTSSSRHRDIDLVVYGERESLRVVEHLLQLYARRVLRPAPDDYGAVRREYSEEAWRLLANRNPLQVRAWGRSYTIRLVACKEPVPCREPVARSMVYTRVVVKRPLSPCIIPARYEISSLAPLLYTLRTSLACMPAGTLLEGVFTLEVYPGESRLVPDGGVARLRLLQG